jgi:TPR repeat protein
MHLMIDGKIDGKNARFIFDTGSWDPITFLRSAIDCFNSKIFQKDGISLTSFELQVEGKSYGKVEAVVQSWPLPQDGLFGWPAVQGKIVRVDWSAMSVSLLPSLPDDVDQYSRFQLVTNVPVAAIRTTDGGPGLIYLDTGATAWVSLSTARWNRWIKDNPNQPTTLESGFSPGAGMFAKELKWADYLRIGALTFTNMPVEEETYKWPCLDAHFGIGALRRFDLIFDLTKQMVYFRNRKDFEVGINDYNRLGAAFIPESLNSEYLWAKIVKDSPADRAGIRDGDILLKVDDKKVIKWSDIGLRNGKPFSFAPAGTKYKLTIRRDGKTEVIPVVLENIFPVQESNEQEEWGRTIHAVIVPKTMLESNRAAYAQFNIGSCYHYGDAQDHKEGLKWCRSLAEDGCAAAQVGLGNFYNRGEGVQQNYTNAATWYRKAAEQGFAEGQWSLGVCYEHGNGVPQDYGNAANWYRKAAEQGNAVAQNHIGICYYFGNGVAQDYAEAVRWYRKAVEQGDACAQNNLGDCYLKGNGVAKDQVEAVKLFRKSAEQGNADGQCRLGLCYTGGIGVTKDKAEEERLLRKSAAQGNAVAQSCLKKMSIMPGNTNHESVRSESLQSTNVATNAIFNFPTNESIDLPPMPPK